MEKINIAPHTKTYLQWTIGLKMKTEIIKLEKKSH